MLRKKRNAPEVNAGSMADIAFLLLIFFLVTTTTKIDQGISRVLPPKLEANTKPPKIERRNIFKVEINQNDELLVQEQPMELKELRKKAIQFLDNGAINCLYCQGEKAPASSENPEKAVISIVNHWQTSYKMYTAIQNELVAAYTFLWNREAKILYNTSYQELANQYDKKKAMPELRLNLKKKMETVRERFPERISEAEPKR